MSTPSNHIDIFTPSLLILCLSIRYPSPRQFADSRHVYPPTVGTHSLFVYGGSNSFRSLDRVYHITYALQFYFLSPPTPTLAAAERPVRNLALDSSRTQHSRLFAVDAAYVLSSCPIEVSACVTLADRFTHPCT